MHNQRKLKSPVHWNIPSTVLPNQNRHMDPELSGTVGTAQPHPLLHALSPVPLAEEEVAKTAATRLLWVLGTSGLGHFRSCSICPQPDGLDKGLTVFSSEGPETLSRVRTQPDCSAPPRAAQETDTQLHRSSCEKLFRDIELGRLRGKKLRRIPEVDSGGSGEERSFLPSLQFCLFYGGTLP